MFVLDTDTLTLFLRAHPKVVDRMSRASAEVVLTAVTRMEQLRGRFDAIFKAENRAGLVKAQERLAETENDLARFDILPIDEETATEFDRLLAAKGLRRIGRGDLLIASIVLANAATLVTRNFRDFQKVPGLQIENWAD